MPTESAHGERLDLPQGQHGLSVSGRAAGAAARPTTGTRQATEIRHERW
ncbi:hypothetical protein [Streptomyces althioticus]